MFTAAAIALVVVIAWLVQRNNNRDRRQYDETPGADTGVWFLLLHIRQDIALVAWLLGGVIVMLGIVADRIG